MSETARICNPSCCGDGVPREVALRELGRFAQSWRRERLLDLAPGERLTRRAMEALLMARSRGDDGLLAELREHPRWVYMVAVHEAYGISKLRFLEQVREVRLLEETAAVLYLVLPGRARLQADLEAVTASDPPTTGRDAVEERLVARAEAVRSVRDALLFRPDATYRSAARESCGGDEPAYLAGVREVRVIPETESSLALVLPAVGR